MHNITATHQSVEVSKTWHISKLVQKNSKKFPRIQKKLIYLENKTNKTKTGFIMLQLINYKCNKNKIIKKKYY